MRPYKVLITSLTMAAAATALSCAAATAQEGAVTIRSSDSLTREQTQALVVNYYLVRTGAAPVAEAEEGIGSGQNVPEAEVATDGEDAVAPVQDETPAVPVAESHEPEVVQTEVILAPSPEPSTPPAAEPEPSSDADVAITPEPEPSTPAPEPSGESEVPITPEPVRSERDEVPAEQRPTDDVVPVIEPEPEPSSTPRASQDPSNVNREVPIAPSDERGSSPAVQDSGEALGAGEVEVVIAPEAPAPVKPSTQQPKDSTVRKQDEKVSPSAIPAQDSRTEKRRELAYTGVTESSGGLAIGGFMLIATGAAGVFAVRRRVEP